MFRPRLRRGPGRRARRPLDIQALEDRAVPATATFGSLAVDPTQAPTDLLVRFRPDYAGPGLTAPASASILGRKPWAWWTGSFRSRSPGPTWPTP
jgi:hypothetical protein